MMMVVTMKTSNPISTQKQKNGKPLTAKTHLTKKPKLKLKKKQKKNAKKKKKKKKHNKTILGQIGYRKNTRKIKNL